MGEGPPLNEKSDRDRAASWSNPSSYLLSELRDETKDTGRLEKRRGLGLSHLGKKRSTQARAFDPRVDHCRGPLKEEA